GEDDLFAAVMSGRLGLVRALLDHVEFPAGVFAAVGARLGTRWAELPIEILEVLRDNGWDVRNVSIESILSAPRHRRVRLLEFVPWAVDPAALRLAIAAGDNR